MKINWSALGLVSVVALVSTLLVVGAATLGIKALAAAQDREKLDQSGGTYRVAGYAAIALAALGVLYGIYLIVPQFH